MAKFGNGTDRRIEILKSAAAAFPQTNARLKPQVMELGYRANSYLA